MPSLGNQYFALGGSLPELSLTSLTRLLPSSSANDALNASQPSLFTLVHHPAPLYVYSSQQHLGTPFINPNGSITFGSFLSPGSSLCNPNKINLAGSSASINGKSTGSTRERCARDTASDEDCTISTANGIKKEDDGGVVMDQGLRIVTTTTADASSDSTASTPTETKMPATYSPITAHMIQPHGTLNRAVPVMTLPTFGALTRNLHSVATVHGASPPHPNIIPHISPYSSLITTSTSSPGTTSHPPHPSHIVTTPTSLNVLSRTAPPPPPTSHLSSPLSSAAIIRHPPLSPMHSSSTLDNKTGVLRQIGVPPPTELYLGGPPMNGVQHVHMKQEEGDTLALTPTSDDQLLTHRDGMKREKDKPYRCDHPGCERSFSFPAHLRSHIQQIHISYRPCKCEFPGCGKRFYTPQHLNVHRRVHTGERPFVCPYADCSKAFTTAGNLKNHIRTHTGERPYACKFEGCTKRFAEMSSLKKHELTHTGEKPYKCRVCGKAFSQAGSRNTHERKHNRTDGEEMMNEGKMGRRYRIKRIPATSDYKSNHD